ncbi:MAG: hypothetical protein AAGB12_12915 [Pseudomonadota bacterium]
MDLHIVFWLKQAFLVHTFQTFQQAYRTNVAYIHHYPYRRLHGSLGLLPPKEFL